MKHLVLVLFLALVLVGCGDNSTPTENSNLAKSVTFTVYSTNWELSPGFAVYQKFIPEITKRVLDNGLILVYMQAGNDYSWTLWDKTIADIENEYSFIYMNYMSLASVSLVVLAYGTDELPMLLGETQKFKVVILDGYPTSIFEQNKEDFSDFRKVEKMFNIVNINL
jgi:hypothetical protein